MARQSIYLEAGVEQRNFATALEDENLKAGCQYVGSFDQIFLLSSFHNIVSKRIGNCIFIIIVMLLIIIIMDIL